MTSAKAFGEKLRAQRERRGISLAKVAEQTKIGPAFLKALERGDCTKWPAGIYSRAWIRAYATAVGLDRDDVAAQFNRCFGHVAFPDGAAPAKTPASADLPRITPLRLALAPDPQERLRILKRRGLLLVADLLLSVLLATLVSALPLVEFWAAFALAAMTCHAVGLIGGGGSAAGWIERSVRQHARPRDDSAGDAVAEAA